MSVSDMETARIQRDMQEDMGTVHRSDAGLLELSEDGREMAFLRIHCIDMEHVLADGGSYYEGNPSA